MIVSSNATAVAFRAGGEWFYACHAFHAVAPTWTVLVSLLVFGFAIPYFLLGWFHYWLDVYLMNVHWSWFDCRLQTNVTPRHDHQHAPTNRQLLRQLVWVALVAVTPFLYVFIVLRSPASFQCTPLRGWSEWIWELGFKGLVMGGLCNEVLFYATHRTMHVYPELYRRFHALHHQWNAPVAWAAAYAHPVEVVVCDLLPMMAAPWVLNMHWQALFVWCVLGVFVSQIHHSGLRWPVMISGSSEQPEFHDEHHRLRVGNFGMTGLMDSLFGTRL